MSEPATALRCIATAWLFTGSIGSRAPTAHRVQSRFSKGMNGFRSCFSGTVDSKKSKLNFNAVVAA